ncbi:MAG: hypothetical protein KatS3mg111_3952 [Pirellulaceae bacterium]|nr:MAG: hypothetical protein KatS3mg111_3952 [Pirellulaceae bacterium]
MNSILRQLGANTSKLPTGAIHAARKYRELLVPRLIECLSTTTQAARRGDVPTGNAHISSLLLLLEFQTQEAFPTIVDACTLPGEILDELYGELIFELLPGILAQVSSDRPETLDAILDNPSLDASVRWAAAQAYLHHVRDGRLFRQDAVRRLQGHLRKAMERKDGEMTEMIINELANLGPHEAHDDIKLAFDQGLVGAGIINWESVERAMAGGEEEVRKSLAQCAPTGVRDALRELERWGVYHEQAPNLLQRNRTCFPPSMTKRLIRLCPRFVRSPVRLRVWGAMIPVHAAVEKSTRNAA